MCRLSLRLSVVFMWSLATATPVIGQVSQVATRGPRFLVAASPLSPPVPLDVRQVEVFRRRVSLDLTDASLEQALTEITRQAGLRFMYSKNVLAIESRVQLQAKRITVAAALTELLVDAGVDVVLTHSGQAMLVRQDSGRSATIEGGTITGRVTDAKTSLGVAQAEVFLDGTRWRVTTDTMGRYRLTEVTPGSYMLAVRRFGYARQRQRVTLTDERTDTVDIALNPVPTRLGELVSTATGRRRRVEIANDVTLLDADSIVRTEPVSSVTDLLEHRVLGLTVQRTSGAPGDPARLRLRGTSSPLRNNDPIVFVDGIRIYAEQSANRSANLARSRTGGVDTAAGQAYAAPSPLDYIDPNSIETIEVVKGPSAATLYGQDAANGVIVITTKKGRAGPPRWTMGAEHGRQKIVGEYPELFLRWGHAIFDNVPVHCPITNMAGTAPCVGDSLVTFQLLNDPDLTVLDKGHHTAATLGVSGGSSALTYAVTGSYHDEVGLTKLPDYEVDRYQALFGMAPPDWMRRPQHFVRWGATSVMAARLGGQADVTLRMDLSRTEQQRSSLENQLGALMSTYLDRASGTYYRTDRSIVLPVTNALDGYYERATDNATQVTTGANLSYRPHRWFTLTADAGISLVQRADQLFFPRGARNSTYNDTTGYVNDAQGRSIVSTVRARGNITTPMGAGFVFRFAAGADYTQTSTNDVAASTSDLPPGSSLQGAVNRFIRRAEASNTTLGWYGEPSIGNSRFNFTSGLRFDGGSSYGGSTNGLSLPTFPKLGFSYILSEEPWFPLRNVAQVFRVRVAYGKASRQPGATDRLRLYTVPTQAFAGGQLQTVLALQTLGNTDVRPERTAELEGGFDADLLDSRVHLSLTGYRKTTDDALLSVPVAPSVYGSGVQIAKNIGVTRNTGIELEVGAEWLRSGPVQWNTQLQLQKNRNVVVKLGPGLQPFYTYSNAGADNSGGFGGLRIVPGYPLNGRWSTPILGYADANGDGVVEREEIQLGDTAIYAGAIEPNYEVNLQTSFGLWHRAVNVTAMFSYQDGLAQRNEVAQGLAAFSRGAQDPTTSLSEQVATIDLSTLSTSAGRQTDYNWIQTVNTMRFSSLAVRYTVPVRVARRLGAQTLSVAVQGTNLGLWTDYRGLDPNVNAFGTGNNVTDTGVLPQPRTWQVRINATY